MISLDTGRSMLTLNPGEWYFGKEYTQLYTVLGSCVALTAWHPQYQLGGLCHFLLPENPKYGAKVQVASENDFRYANAALKVMKQSMLRIGPMTDFRLGLFGGGDMFAFNTAKTIGKENIRYAQAWLAQEKLVPQQVDVGDTFSRTITLNLLTGNIALKCYQMKAQ